MRLVLGLKRTLEHRGETWVRKNQSERCDVTETHVERVNGESSGEYEKMEESQVETRFKSPLSPQALYSCLQAHTRSAGGGVAPIEITWLMYHQEGNVIGPVVGPELGALAMLSECRIMLWHVTCLINNIVRSAGLVPFINIVLVIVQHSSLAVITCLDRVFSLQLSLPITPWLEQ
ncbi:hypothetical protein RRG08_029231 [Elysia crispata]|uniref:Uncharacterized protein n=1 Tax=Elysia crispata TaxID=231223 RepID=A0AAE1AJG2_9GAST|nr:hypothetical protein RRG08_029231 [Elysia crispata]